MRTLGWNKEQLHDRLHHISYDGVYASSFERGEHVGGGLSLANHIAEYLGLDEGQISSNWDLGHKLELMMADVSK